MAPPMGNAQGQGSGDSEIVYLVLVVVAVIAIGWFASAWAREINLLFAGLCWPILDVFAGLGHLVDGFFAATGGAGARLPLIDLLWRTPMAIVDSLVTRDVAALTPDQRDMMVAVAVRRLGLLASGVFVLIAIRAEDWHVDENRKALNSLAEQIWRQTERHKSSRHMRRRTKLFDARDVDRRYVEEGARKADVEIAAIGVAGAMKPSRPQVAPPTNWASAMRPEEWLMAKGVTSTFDLQGDREELISATESALADQLTRPWLGFAALTPTRRALAGAFCCYFGFDRNRGEALLEDLCHLFSVAPEMIDRRGEPWVDMDAAILAEEGLSRRIDALFETMAAKEMEKALTRAHAYEETAFFAMLMMSRSTQEDMITELAAADTKAKYSGRGLLPTSQLVWLKEFDRGFYYALNTAGSNTPVVEAAGVFAHYQAERAFRIPLPIPYVWQAARAVVDDYLDLSPERVAKKAAIAERRRTLADKFELEMDQKFAVAHPQSEAGLIEAARGGAA